MMTRIWTIGHSTRTIEEFIAALQANGIKLVSDVRLLPGSKRYPQFNKETLAKSLNDAGITYVHLPELGGRRRPRKDSRNTAWRNDAFRGYADHMETAEYSQGIARLQEMAERHGGSPAADGPLDAVPHHVLAQARYRSPAANGSGRRLKCNRHQWRQYAGPFLN